MIRVWCLLLVGTMAIFSARLCNSMMAPEPANEFGLELETVPGVGRLYTQDSCRNMLTQISLSDPCSAFSVCCSTVSQPAVDACATAHLAYTRLPDDEKLACPSPGRPGCHLHSFCGSKKCTFFCSGVKRPLTELISNRTKQLVAEAAARKHAAARQQSTANRLQTSRSRPKTGIARPPTAVPRK